MGSIEEPTVGTHHFHYSPQFNTQAAAAATDCHGDNKTGCSICQKQAAAAELYFCPVITAFPNVIQILQDINKIFQSECKVNVPFIDYMLFSVTED